MFKRFIFVAMAICALCAAMPAVSGATKFHNALTQALTERGITDEDLAEVLLDRELISTIVDLVNTSKVIDPDRRELAGLIAAANTVTVIDRININTFPASKEHVADPSRYQLLTFKRGLTVDQVLKEMEIRGLRPGTLRELLIYVAKHSDDTLHDGIQALGSREEWSNGLNKERGISAPCAIVESDGEGYGPSRDLSLCVTTSDAKFDKNERFLAVIE